MSAEGLDRADRPSPHGTVVLVAATAAALLLGGWWWTSNPPAAGDGWAWGSSPGGPQPPVAAEAAEPTEPARPNLPGDLSLLGGPTGLAEAGRADPPMVAPAEIIELDSVELEALLPASEDVIRRQVGVLTASDIIDYSGAVPAGGSYLLEVVCVGDGALEVSVTVPGGAQSVSVIACDGALRPIELSVSRTGTAVVLLEANTSSLMGVATQLLAR